MLHSLASWVADAEGEEEEGVGTQQQQLVQAVAHRCQQRNPRLLPAEQLMEGGVEGVTPSFYVDLRTQADALLPPSVGVEHKVWPSTL